MGHKLQIINFRDESDINIINESQALISIQKLKAKINDVSSYNLPISVEKDLR